MLLKQSAARRDENSLQIGFKGMLKICKVNDWFLKGHLKADCLVK